MRKDMMFLGASVILATLLLIVYGLSALPRTATPRSGAASSELEALKQPTVTFVNPALGPADAKVTLVVFGDYLCASCADLSAALRQLAREMPNDVRVVWKDLPTRQSAVKAAIAARCAGVQGKFWEYHSLLMAQQTSINDTSLPLFAQQIGLDTTEFQNCLDNETTRPLVERDYEEGVRLNIDAAPFMFVGERRISGALTLPLLKTLIQEESSRSKQVQPVPDGSAGQ